MAFTYLKVKSAKCMPLFTFGLGLVILVWLWSSGLSLKKLVLFTSLAISQLFVARPGFPHSTKVPKYVSKFWVNDLYSANVQKEPARAHWYEAARGQRRPTTKECC